MDALHAHGDELLIATVREHAWVRLLLRALELYDGGQTYAHSWRTARGALVLGGRLGWETTDVVRCARAALLHDTGKVFIRTETIMKPGRLTDAETGEIRTHPRFGFEIVREVDPDAAHLLVAHHECAWRPSGEEHRNYPRSHERRACEERRRIMRLFGHERRHARRRSDDGADRHLQFAIAMADVVDALASERWYKASWPSERIRPVLRDHFRILAEIAEWLVDAREHLGRPVPMLTTIARHA